MKLYPPYLFLSYTVHCTVPLLAFCASDDDNSTWWDREDEAYSGIPYTVKSQGISYTYRYNEDTALSNKANETLADGTFHSFYDNEKIEHELLPDGTSRWWRENGIPNSEKLPDGTQRRWHSNGVIEFEHLPDGTSHQWYGNGHLNTETLSDGTYREWYYTNAEQDEKISYERLPDGSITQWYRNGQVSSFAYPNGYQVSWDENGNLSSEKTPDGTMRTWYENGVQQSETLPDGSGLRWFKNGILELEVLQDGTTLFYRNNGILRAAELPDGTNRHYNNEGKLYSETLPDLTLHYFDENGNEIYNQSAHNQQEASNLTTTTDSNKDAIAYFNNYKAQHPDGFITPDALERFDQLVTHATGHIIWNNRFDLQFVGTGEGNAAFGFGAYFEQNPQVAQSYRGVGLSPQDWAGNTTITLKNGKAFSWRESKHWQHNSPDVYGALFQFTHFFNNNPNATTHEALATVEDNYKALIRKSRNDKESRDSLRKELHVINSIAEISHVKPKRGNIYSFDIPENYELLDWDASLDEQPEQVQKAIKKIFASLRRQGFSRDDLLQLSPTIGEIDSGEALYMAIVHAFEHADNLDADLYGLKHKGITRANARASWLFNKFGIPGHRYWDGISRNSQEGTHNFVIWNMDKVTMTGISDDSDELARKTFYNEGKQQLRLFDDSGNPASTTFISPEQIERYEQLAYHGTDNTILGNRFDLRYAGSSTGGMAFGYGAYFAQNINVAQQYRHGGDSLKQDSQRISITTKDGRKYQSTGPRTWSNGINSYMQDAFDDLHEHATNSDSLDLEKLKKDILASYRQELKEHKSILAELKRELKQNPRADTSDKIKLRQQYINSTKEKIKAIQSVTDISVLPPKKGNIYSFDIPDNDKLLDWDKSIYRQPEIVKKARREILQELKRWGLDGSEAKKAKTGGDFYMALVNIMRTQTDDYFAYPQSGIKDPKQKASLILNLHDVPGLRFLDGFSREGATRSKSHNFVIWNTDTITMLGVEGNPEAEQHFHDKLHHDEGETYHQQVAQWQDTIDAVLRKEIPGNAFLKVTTAPRVFQLLNTKLNPIYINAGKIHRIRHDHPTIYRDILRLLPDGIPDPIAIFKDNSIGEGNVKILTNIVDNRGRNVVVPIRMSYNIGSHFVSKIATVYPVENDNRLLRKFTDGNLLYLNRFLAAKWERRTGLTLPIDYDGSFFTEQDLANLSTGKANGKRRKNPAPNILYWQNNSTETASNDNNQSFLTPERYEQLMHHGSRNILVGNGFDLKYLSTGEGGQAYGYGIYLGEAFGTGEAYRTAGMSGNETSNFIITSQDGQSFTISDFEKYMRQKAKDKNLDTKLRYGYDSYDIISVFAEYLKNLHTSHSSVEDIIRDFVEHASDMQGDIHESIEKAKLNIQSSDNPTRVNEAKYFLDTDTKRLERNKKEAQRLIQPFIPAKIVKNSNRKLGNHYLVDGPENDVLLDWDAPMSKQPTFVLEALKRGGIYLNDEETGEHLYRRLVRYFSKWKQNQHGTYETVEDKNSERLASQKLNELGIPGHRFWDAGSRDKQHGTHNFVIWNTDTLTLLGLTDDSDSDAHEYFHAEDYYKSQLDSLDNDSDIRNYSNADYDYDMAHIDDIADANMDALDYGSNGETYYQIIGKYGAGFLNNSEDLSYNLGIAKQMTAQRKDARIIRLATGWELGIDGKWKYEIMDGNVIHDALKRNKPSFSLAEIFNAPELFSAYSNIYLPNGKKGFANIQVRFDDLNGEAYGYFNPHDFSISLERSLKDNPKKLRSVLIHEIQHAIQRIEGFAVGGNETTGDTLRTKAEIWALRNEIIDTENEHPELAKSKKLIGIVRQQNIDAGFDAPDNDMLNRAFYLYLHGDSNGEYQNAWEQWGKLGITHNPNDYRTRDRLAGEVEARNAQTRAAFSQEQRKNTLLADTEDTVRDEQIISETYSQARNTDDFLTPDARRQVDAIRTKYQGTTQWLKAPNGQNTKLSELQWLLVRTNNFKHWFGDWENDAANSSKVLDDNGEPLVVHHGTNYAGFSVFKGQYGHWFSRDRDVAETYINGSYSSDYDTVHPNDGKGTGVYSVFLNIRNPLIVDYQGYGALSDSSGNEQPAYYLENLYDFGDYDGVICTNIKDEGGYLGGYEELDEDDNPVYEYDNSVFGVPSAGNIKSATDNNGDFSTTNNAIYKQSAADRDMDARYFDALNAEDMNTARSIVDAQARAKGYSPDNEHRMQHKAPNSQDGVPNLANVMTSDFVPADYWTHPQYYLYSPEEWDSFYSVMHAVKNKKLLTVYRAVPNDIKETALRNGDWVTPSRDYAVQHGQCSLDGKYRIIAAKVSPRFLWWDGNSIAEFGYDNGKDYAYRNTKNNRKLNDTIVHGNDDSIVPPSKRFNYRKSEEYYQAANLQRNPFVETYTQLHTFDNPNAERAYRRNRAKPQKKSLLQRIKQTMHELAHGFKGDFPLLAGKEGRAKGLTAAREYLRIMNRNSDAKTHMTLASLYDSLHGLNAEQLDIFSRFMLLNDIRNFIHNNPPSRGQTLFGYTQQSFIHDYNKFLALVKGDKAILNAIQAEQTNNKKARQDLIQLATSLGFKQLAKRLQANDFFLIQYADLLGDGDINTNYVIATAEMRSILLQDFERLLAVKKLKAKYDKGAALVQQFGKDWKLHIPEGYSTFNPLAGSFIQSAHPFTDNILGAALDEMEQQLGLSDKTMDALHSKLAEPFDTQLLVLPNEIVQTLQKMNGIHNKNPTLYNHIQSKL